VSAAPRRLVVVCTGRSGGTFLGTTLASAPKWAFETEPLGIRRDLGAAGQLQWARRFLTGPRWRRPEAIGMSTKVADIEDPDGFAAMLRDLDARAVLLLRRNEVKQVVSILRARVLRDTVGRWNLRDDSDRPGPIRVDPEDLATRLEWLRERNAETVDYAEALGVPLLRLHYEDLLVEPDRAFARVFAHLGLPDRPLTPVTVKATSDDLRGSVENFDELRAAFADTPLVAQFDEVLAES
jgi:LPS sulfotransferase NodH